MKDTSGYIPIDSRYPLRGLNSKIPSTQIDPAFSPAMNNMFIREGVAFKRGGYWELVIGATSDLNGDLMDLVEFHELDDTRNLCAITTTRQYYFDPTGDSNAGSWVEVTVEEGEHEIIAIADGGGGVDQVTIQDDFTGTFLVGTEFTIEDSTANNGSYIVVAVALSGGNTVIDVATGSWSDTTEDGTLVGPIYVGTNIDTGNEIIRVDGDQTAVFSASAGVDGNRIRISGSTADDGYYTLTTVALNGGDTDLTVSGNLTSTLGSARVHIVHDSTAIAGDVVDSIVGTDNNNHRLYATNGRDRPFHWTGPTAKFRRYHPSYDGFVTCKTFDIFFGLMILGNITTTAADPKLIAWSDTNNFDDFTNGNTGTLLIPTVIGLILRFIPLGDRLIVYSTDSIVGLTYVGSPVFIAAEVIIQNTRLASPRAMATFGSAHLFASEENLYFFDGTRSTRAVGDTIRELYKKAINLEYAYRLFMFNDVAKRLLWVNVPISSTAMRSFILDYDIFDLNEFKWTQSELLDLPLAMGFYVRSAGAGWDDPPPVSWENRAGIWDEEGDRINFPVRVMGAGSEVFQMDGSTFLDDVTAVTASYETRDFTVPGEDQSVLGRWAEIEIDMKGTTDVGVYYSTDLGQSFTLIETRTLSTDFTVHQIFLDITSRTIRIKLGGTSFFAFRALRIWVKPNAPR